MMAPTMIIEPSGRLTALGSGGSNRIRTAILQVLLNLLDFSMELSDAVEAPRAHFEQGLLSLESGFEEAVVAAVKNSWPEFKAWDERNLFFGGVHVVRSDSTTGELVGAGDPRRGGVALNV